MALTKIDDRGLKTPIDLLDNEKIRLGTGNDLEIYHEGSHSYIKDAGTGDLKLLASTLAVNNAANTEAMIVAIEDGSVSLYHDASKRFETHSEGTYHYGHSTFIIGDEGESAQLFLHADDGDDNADKWKIVASAGGPFYLQNYTSGSWESNLIAYGNGGVELYYDNTRKAYTSSDGFRLDDNLRLDDSKEIRLGTGEDLKIYHDGSHSYLNNVTGNLLVQIPESQKFQVQHGAEAMINGYADGRVELYHDNGLRFQTSSEGIDVGSVKFTGTRNSNIEHEVAIFAASGSQGSDHLDNHVVSIGQANGNWLDGSGATDTDTSFGLMWHYANSATGTRALRAGIHYDHKSTEQFKIWSSYGSIAFYVDTANSGNDTAEECNVKCAEFDASGHFVPGSNNARDLGTSSLRWRNVYTNDLHLSNEGSSNDIDSTWGNWTIQEGESDLFLKNNRSGKKYKFNLTEVS